MSAPLIRLRGTCSCMARLFTLLHRDKWSRREIDALIGGNIVPTTFSSPHRASVPGFECRVFVRTGPSVCVFAPRTYYCLTSFIIPGSTLRSVIPPPTGISFNLTMPLQSGAGIRRDYYDIPPGPFFILHLLPLHAGPPPSHACQSWHLIFQISLIG